MASFTRPTYVDEGVQQFGSGIFCSNYRVLKAAKHSDYFFKGANKKVPSDKAYIEDAHKFAATLPAIDESTLVRTSDGVDLIWFTKRGMFSPFGAVWEIFYFLSLAAIQLLLQFFPPPTKLSTDKRHRDHLRKEKSRWEAKKCQYGVYHFAYWYMKFHDNGNWPPLISADARPAAPTAMRALFDYISDTTWEHRLISGWFKALDEVTWKKYNSRYQELRNEGELGHLDLGAKELGCFLGHALLINTYVDPHKDSGDVKWGWVFTYPWMKFEGGDAVYLDLGLRFKQRAGDFIMSRSCVLVHMTMRIISGQRWGNTWFTKAKVLETPVATFLCKEPGCAASYVSQSGLQWHKTKYHSKDVAVGEDDVVDDEMLPEEEEEEGEWQEDDGDVEMLDE